MKQCDSCKQFKNLNDFHRVKKVKCGRINICKTCISIQSKKEYVIKKDHYKQYYIDNKEHILQRTNNYEQTHKEQRNKWYRNKYHEKLKNDPVYKEIAKKKAKLWKKDNKGKVTAQNAKRRAMKKQAVPKWAELELIKTMYEKANILSLETKISYQVDHIVPLINKIVCGLHCYANLRIITAKENNEKGNKLVEKI